MTLNNYATPTEFWDACRAMHRDERDPEFMFPDYELPDFLGGCITESHIDTTEIWAYLNAPAPVEEETESAEYTKAQIKTWKAAFIDSKLATDSWHASAKDKEKHDAHWRAFYEKKYLCVLPCGDGVFVFDKPSVQTTFCFGAGYNGMSTDEDWDDAFAQQSEIHKYENWLKANTENIEDDILGITAPNDERRSWRNKGTKPFVCADGRELYLLWRHSELDTNMPEDARPATPEERRVLLAGFQMQLADITRRCKAYWKRYGSSKLNTWTYLRD